MKVYFFGSISGGVHDIEEWYRPLILHIKQRAEVLSEEIFFHPKIVSEGKEDGFTDSAIFRRDVGMINNADLLIGDITLPSHGVGWEMRHAQGLRKPVLCLFRTSSGKIPSAMITGNPGLIVRQYKTLAEAKTHVDAFLTWFAKNHVRRKKGLFNFFS